MVVALFLLILDTMSPSGRGVFEPPLHGPADPAKGELVAWESELEDWDGRDLIEAYPPWFLASERLCEAVVASGLVGLRLGGFATVTRPGRLAKLMELGEVDRLPAFRIVVPERAVTVRGAQADSISSDESLYYSDWLGDDWSTSKWGPVVTERALDVVRAFELAATSIYSLRQVPGA